MCRLVVLLLLLGTATWPGAREEPQPALAAAALKFAVIGDNGTGDQAEYEVGRQMAAARTTFPFEFVIMLGDNLYGSQNLAEKFEQPFAALIGPILDEIKLGAFSTILGAVEAIGLARVLRVGRFSRRPHLREG